MDTTPTRHHQPETPTDAVEQFVLTKLAELISSNGGHRRGPLERSLQAAYMQLQVAFVVHHLLLTGVTATQRDVYYRLEKHFPAQLQCNRAIAHLSAHTGLARSALNIVASGRGAVGGCMRYNGIDLRHIGPQGLSIDSSMMMISPLQQQGRRACGSSQIDRGEQEEEVVCVLEARMLLIVEKDAVFYRLMESRIFDHIPVILLSGFGFPSAAARSLAATICDVASRRNGGRGPQLQVFALVDYNPSGVHIMLKYMEAGEEASARVVGSSSSAAMDISQAAFSRGIVVDTSSSCVGEISTGGRNGLSYIRWLGVRSTHLNSNTSGGTAPLTERDHRMLASLLKNCPAGGVATCKGAPLIGSLAPPQRWWGELCRMQEGGVRFDIEAWYRQRTHIAPTAWLDDLQRSILRNDAL